PLVGLPNTKDTYKLKYVLTPNYLKLMKQGLRRDIPVQEYPYAELAVDHVDDSMDVLLVPLVGYKIEGYYKVEAVKNEDDEATSRLTEIRVESPDQGEYFRLDM